jgi:hypothetical protein
MLVLNDQNGTARAYFRDQALDRDLVVILHKTCQQREITHGENTFGKWLYAKMKVEIGCIPSIPFVLVLNRADLEIIQVFVAFLFFALCGA